MLMIKRPQFSGQSVLSIAVMVIIYVTKGQLFVKSFIVKDLDKTLEP